MVFIIQGKKITSATTTATIFGINVRVCSWIEVAVWTMLIATPTTSPASNMGAATKIAVKKDLAAKMYDHLLSHLFLSTGYQLNDRITLLTSRYHPSTITNSKTLNGNEIIIGGNIIIPIESSTLETIISIMRKGR